MSGARRALTGGALLFILLAHGRLVAAQGEERYLRLVESYRLGDSTASIVELAGWQEPRLRDAFRAGDIRIKSGLLPLPEERIEAAAMLHTETALAIGNRQLAFLHIERARSLLASVPKDDREHLGVTAFTARWVALESIVFASYGYMARARTVLDEALRADADNVDALLVKGSLQYVQLSAGEPNPRGRWNSHNVFTNVDNVFPGASDDEGLAKASSDLLSALVARHPESLEARLRLGWALLINHSPTSKAREQLDVVAARATRQDLRYLAHLFLGAVEARDGHLEQAGTEYAQAIAVLPRQAAYMGLIQIDRERGLTDESERLAIELSKTRPALDPWQPFNAGLTSYEIIDWLQHEARAR